MSLLYDLAPLSCLVSTSQSHMSHSLQFSCFHKWQTPVFLSWQISSIRPVQLFPSLFGWKSGLLASSQHYILFIVYMFVSVWACTRVCSNWSGQKRALYPITDGCEQPCGCWELNSGPLEEQSVLLTTEPSLQPIQSKNNFLRQVSLCSYGSPASHSVD